MYYIEYEHSTGKINVNYNGYDLYQDCLAHFRRMGRRILSHGVRPC